MEAPVGRQRVLLTGATGFLGSRLRRPLRDAGYVVRCASRRPAAEPTSDEWACVDLADEATLAPAMAGCDVAVYLVHSLDHGAGYPDLERRCAQNFARAAGAAGVGRIVYVGGVAPLHHPSVHLQSRRSTGEALAASGVPTVELQTGIILGSGSASWRILRDLAVRLPVFPDNRWMRVQLEPIPVDDVVQAVLASLDGTQLPAGIYALPGPETLSARELLTRVARHAGRRPRWLGRPTWNGIAGWPVGGWAARPSSQGSPQRAARAGPPAAEPPGEPITRGPRRQTRTRPPFSAWELALLAQALPLLTRANATVARELIEGLRADLCSTADSLWHQLPHLARLPLDAAISRALWEDRQQLPLRTLGLEHLLQLATPFAQSRRP